MSIKFHVRKDFITIIESQSLTFIFNNPVGESLTVRYLKKKRVLDAIFCS